jgi:hypothetical protein
LKQGLDRCHSRPRQAKIGRKILNGSVQ